MIIKKRVARRTRPRTQERVTRRRSPAEKEAPEASRAITYKRDQLNQELMLRLELESDLEAQRELQLSLCRDERERHRLSKILGAERAQAAQAILALSVKHDVLMQEELSTLRV